MENEETNFRSTNPEARDLDYGSIFLAQPKKPTDVKFPN